MSEKDAFLKKYFRNTHYHPPIEQMVEMLPVGELWTHVSNTLLNGFINIFSQGPGPVAAAVGNCLNSSIEPLEEVHEFEYTTRHTIVNTFPLGASKLDVLKILTEQEPCYVRGEKPLSVFGDDVVILFKSGATVNWAPVYWFFHYDAEVSDCLIGRFASEVPEEQIVRDFYAHVDSMSRDAQQEDALRLPKSYFKNWVAF